MEKQEINLLYEDKAPKGKSVEKYLDVQAIELEAVMNKFNIKEQELVYASNHHGANMISNRVYTESLDCDNIKLSLIKEIKKYAISEGLSEEDIEDYCVVECNKEHNEDGDIVLHIQIRNDLFGYYDNPKLIEALDKIVSPGYFEPYDEYVWDAYIWGKDRLDESSDLNESDPQPEVDLYKVGMERKQMANAYGKPIIYGYMGSDHHGGSRYYEIDPIICDDLKKCTADVMKKYHPSGSILVAYPRNGK